MSEKVRSVTSPGWREDRPRRIFHEQVSKCAASANRFPMCYDD